MRIAPLFAGLALAAASAVTVQAGAHHGAHWGYGPHDGPAVWGRLDPAYRLCGEGVNQSPVDLHGFIEAELPPIAFHYGGQGKEVVHNGHAIQVNYEAGSFIEVDGKRFALKQFHFHSPSENTIEGKSFPLEAHFVHVADDGAIAVVAVLFREGADNRALQAIWEVMPTAAGTSAAPRQKIEASALLPESRAYYRFNGSLTTPPCTEGVYWFVMQAHPEVGPSQIQAFQKAMGFANNRPVQPLHARPVLR